MVRLNIFYLSGEYEVDGGSRAGARFPQYAAALSAGSAGLAVGTILAWTSPASTDLLDGKFGFPVGRYELSVIGSLVPIGAAASCIPAGYLTDRIGRKTTLLSLVPFFLLGWCLLIWPTSVEMIYAGRLITGMCGGSVCVTAPVFTAEVAQKEIRGELASYFELLLSAGICLTYVAGSQLSAFYLSVVCAVVPIAFGLALIFFPDTPTFYLTRGRPRDAKKALRFFRGEKYNIETELAELAEASKGRTSGGGGGGGGESLWKAFASKPGARGLALSVAMMVFQQLCGINAFTFYTTTIFQDAGSSLEPKYATIVVGFMQFAGTIFAMFLIDRIGRVLLLGTSASVMAACTVAMGAYFNLKDSGRDAGLSWLPLFCLCVFMIAFAVGYGPVPYILMPEVLPSRIVGTASSVACVCNWLCAFLVTKFFADLVDALGSDVTFWLFAGITVLGAAFSFAALPETKGKSFDEIRRVMSGASLPRDNPVA